MRRKIGVTIAAMIVAAQMGSPAAAEQPTLQQLSTIAGYLAENDVVALRRYLLLHPELLEGDTAIARLLRNFLQESGNLAAFLAFEPDLGEAVSGVVAAIEPVEEPGPPDDDAIY